jgi:hypothetical protein
MIYVLILGILVGAVGYRLYVKHGDTDTDDGEHISDLNAFDDFYVEDEDEDENDK